MYNISLNIGDQVSIYTDFKEEIDYEGEAILLEKLEDGDTFFINEFVASNLSMDSKSDKIKESRNEKLSEVFDGQFATKESFKFMKEILRLRNNKIDEYNKMLNYVLNTKEQLNKRMLQGKYDNDSRFKRILNEIPESYIVRYFQQFNKKVNNSIFKFEKWKVNFIIDRQGYLTEYTCVRKIRLIVRNNYREKNGVSELSDYTTYNGKIPRYNKN